MGMLHYVKTTDDTVIASAMNEIIAGYLSDGKKVLWLVPGGSNIPIAVDVSKRLINRPTHNLRVTLTDERFGPVGHSDSNWQQLLSNGFAIDESLCLPYLSGDRDLSSTMNALSADMQDAFDWADVIVGFFGMGDDGHTAGILPHSPATEPVDTLLVRYQGADYSRITLSFAALRQVTTGFLVARGEAKHGNLEQLHATETSLVEQPVQIVKAFEQTWIYNDIIGETV